jgi:iron complex transport system permease protein
MTGTLSAAAQETLRGYQRLMKRRLCVVGLLGTLLILTLLIDVATGPSSLGLGDVAQGLIDPASLDAQARVIVFGIRLPQAVLAILVGAALALSGAEMQSVLHNPLASPFTLGVSSAAAFGAALAVVFGIGVPGVALSLLVSANAFIFALAAILGLALIAQLRGAGPELVVLFGIGLTFTFNALVAILQFAASQESLQQIVFWTLGSLARASWDKNTLLGILLLVVLPFSLKAAWHLTALRLGEERARSLGINVRALRFFALLRVSLCAAIAVACAGTIAFVGLVAPHIARLLIGEDHRFLLPASLLVGGALVSLASIAAKLILPGVVLPVGIVTALVGLPVFFWLIFGRRERI